LHLYPSIYYKNLILLFSTFNFLILLFNSLSVSSKEQNPARQKDALLKAGIEELISNIILELLSYMAEKERKKIRQRQREEIKKAKENGVNFGRPKIKVDDFEYYYDQDYDQEEMTAGEAMNELDISKSTFYRRKS
jgi:hypothetical protein